MNIKKRLSIFILEFVQILLENEQFLTNFLRLDFLKVNCLDLQSRPNNISPQNYINKRSWNRHRLIQSMLNNLLLLSRLSRHIVLILKLTRSWWTQCVVRRSAFGRRPSSANGISTNPPGGSWRAVLLRDHSHIYIIKFFLSRIKSVLLHFELFNIV